MVAWFTFCAIACDLSYWAAPGRLVLPIYVVQVWILLDTAVPLMVRRMSSSWSPSSLGDSHSEKVLLHRMGYVH